MGKITLSQSPSHRGSLSNAYFKPHPTDPSGNCLNPLRIGEVFPTISSEWTADVTAWSQSPSHRGSLSNHVAIEKIIEVAAAHVSIPFASGKSFQRDSRKGHTKDSSQVSIPFASGKSFQRRKRSPPQRNPGLSQSPSHRGSLSNFEMLRRNDTTSSGLNPLRIGEVFPTLTSDGNPIPTYTVSIPFASGKSFQQMPVSGVVFPEINVSIPFASGKSFQPMPKIAL